MKPITIEIPDMQSTHCQARVSQAVSAVEGAEIQSVTPGKITVSTASDHIKTEIITAIEKAGYSVSACTEKENKSNSCTTGCCSH